MKSVFGFRVRLGNSDLDFENLNPDFPIERTLRVRVSNSPGSPIPKYWLSTTLPARIHHATLLAFLFFFFIGGKKEEERSVA